MEMLAGRLSVDKASIELRELDRDPAREMPCTVPADHEIMTCAARVLDGLPNAFERRTPPHSGDFQLAPRVVAARRGTIRGGYESARP